MDINTILGELREERARIEEAIIALERVSLGTPRRGRPPAWLKEIEAAPVKRRGRPPGSKTRRKASAETA